MAFADLHFHSSHSDGKHSVEWLLSQLKKGRNQGLSFAALTDHDGISGFKEFSATVSEWWKPLCASELSCTFEDPQTKKQRELHLLVYGLNPEDAELKKYLEKFKEERVTRFFKICERLSAAGITVDAQALFEQHKGVLGRPHVADALVLAGHAKDREDAFNKYLKDHGRFDVPKWRFDLEEAVAYAKRLGCRTSIAHPGQYDFRDKTLEYFKSIGVDALEVYHPRHQDSDLRYYQIKTAELKMMRTGGSDFHHADSDRLGDSPSIGRRGCPFEEAKVFLEPFL